MNAPTTSHYPAAPTAQKPRDPHAFGAGRQRAGRAGARHRPVLRAAATTSSPLTVSETEHRAASLAASRSSPRGTPMVIEQIKNQLDRLVPGASRGRHDACRRMPSSASSRWSRCKGKGDNRVEALRLADAFRARVIDATTESFVFEITGASDKIEQFISADAAARSRRGRRARASPPSCAGRKGCRRWA